MGERTIAFVNEHTERDEAYIFFISVFDGEE